MRRVYKIFWIVALSLVVAAWHASPGVEAQNMAPALRPFPNDEKLTYRLQWPSGITLGEAVFQVTASGEELHFRVTVEASLPQYTLRDTFFSTATAKELCSLQFRQEISEGTRKWDESIEFDQAAQQARRARNGQTATASVPPCARDPLTFLYYFRSQLAAGRPLVSGTLHLGENFNLRIRAAGSETVEVRGQSRLAEKYVMTYSGPNREKSFEVWISTDATHVPVRVRVPFPLAVFTAELQ